MIRSLSKIVLIISIIASIASAQTKQVPDSIIVIPNKDYEAGWFYRQWFGDHWRDLWTTPVKVEVLDLETFAGGLIPIRKGGGFSTNSLRLKGNDGRIWKFRSVDKDFGKLIPDTLRFDPVVDVIRDQTSTICPFAPLVVVPILNSLGILQAEPRLVWMPDDEKLGEFREVFGGMLGMIEIHPDEGIPEFEDAEKVVGTFNLFHRLEEKREEKFDKLEYLKARLIDVFLGDWDRHTDQWRWAKYREKRKEIWKPIPRDRDEAFARFNGLLPSIAEYIIPQFVTFDENFRQTEDITWSGRFLDRRILQEVTKQEWDSVSAVVINCLTDDLIDFAVKHLPPEHYEKAGAELLHALKSRRDKLLNESEKYFKLVNKYVDVFASNKNDYLSVRRLQDFTEITLFKKNKDTNLPTGEPFFYKLADNSLTRQIRAYLLDGKDKAVITGKTYGGPIVRVIAGDGKDEMIDSSEVEENLFGIIPIPIIKTKTYFYDSGKKTKIIAGAGTVFDDEKVPEPANDLERYEPRQVDRGHDWQYYPVAGYSTDVGFVFGMGPRLYSYDFRIEPFAYRQTMTVEYATLPRSYRIYYEGVFNNIIKGASIIFELEKNELEFTNFYGYGNETIYNSGLYDQDYYRTKQELLMIEPRIEFNLNENHLLGLGFGLNVSETEEINPDVIVSYYDAGKAGTGIFKELFAKFNWRYDGRDNQAFAHNGFYISVNGKYSPKLFQDNHNFFKTHVDARLYIPFKKLSTIVSMRGTGEKIWGDFPYFEASFLGGGKSLRGYAENRFSGDAHLLGQLELRTELDQENIILPSRYGLLFFTESGRVFARNENSKRWHSSFGGGLWISFINYDYTVSATISSSPEGDYIYLNFGMGF